MLVPLTTHVHYKLIGNSSDVMKMFETLRFPENNETKSF